MASTSTSSTRWPCSAASSAVAAVTVLLPTPPLPVKKRRRRPRRSGVGVALRSSHAAEADPLRSLVGVDLDVRRACRRARRPVGPCVGRTTRSAAPSLSAFSTSCTTSSTPPSSSRVSSLGVWTTPMRTSMVQAIPRSRGTAPASYRSPAMQLLAIEPAVVASAGPLLVRPSTGARRSAAADQPEQLTRHPEHAGAGALVGERARAPRAVDLVVPVGGEDVGRSARRRRRGRRGTAARRARRAAGRRSRAHPGSGRCRRRSAMNRQPTTRKCDVDGGVHPVVAQRQLVERR